MTYESDEIHVTPYMQEHLNKLRDKIHPDEWGEYVEEAIDASDLGVQNEADYKALFYIDNFIDDFERKVFGAKLKSEEEANLRRFMFEKRHELDYSNLDSFFIAMIKWIKSKRTSKKQAYPNRHYRNELVKPDDFQVWALLVNEVNKEYIKTGNREVALYKIASLLPPPENLEFMAWYQFKFGDEGKKYNINDLIRQKSESGMKKTIRRAFAIEDEKRFYFPKYNHGLPNDSGARTVDLIKKQNAEAEQRKKEEVDIARSKLISRTFSIDKLLEQHKDAIPVDKFSEIENILNDLRKKIRTLKYTHTIVDAGIKAASMIKRAGFTNESNILKVALGKFSPASEGIIKQALPSGSINPQHLVGIINEVQRIDNELKKRDLIRALSKVDFDLHDLGLSAFFSELSEAQSRLIDAYTYATNKMASILPKMRSTQGLQMGEQLLPPSVMGGPATTPKTPPGRLQDVPQIAEPVPSAPAPTPSPAPLAAPAPIPGPR